MTSKFLRACRTSLVDFCLFLYWCPLRKVLLLLPQPVLFRLTGLFTTLAAACLPGVRNKLVSSLMEWLPGRHSSGEIKAIAHASVRNYMGRLFEELYMGDLNPERMQSLVQVSGEEHLRESVRRGKGTIILLSHFGTHLLPLPALGFLGYKVNQLAGPPTLKHHRRIHEMIFSIREKAFSRLPVTFLRTDLHLKKAVQALRNNELLALAIDGREGDKWVELDFLDKKACFSPGPFRLAVTTGASIVPTCLVRQPDHTHRLELYPPMVFNSASDAALRLGMQQMVNIFDAFVRAHPCHAAMVFLITEERAKSGIVSQPLFVR